MQLAFDERDPFPLLSADSHTYAEAQMHSEKVDAWLGLDTERIEAVLARTRGPGSPSPLCENHWIGLPVKALLTPYTEIRLILSQLNPRAGETLVDLGAGYGRMAFVIGAHYPGVRFVGYECVAERVKETQRCLEPWNYRLVEMIEADLKAPDIRPCKAEYYFLYDFGDREAIAKTLDELKTVARDQKITVIGRGRASRQAIDRDHPWLSQVVAPEHFLHYSLYKSRPQGS